MHTMPDAATTPIGDEADGTGVQPSSQRSHRLVLPISWTVLCAAAVVWLYHLGRSRTFYYDEWDFVTDRWRLSLDAFLAPHNGHLSVVPASVYFVLFRTVGLDHYEVFRVVGLLVHVAVASSVLWYVRRRHGAVAGVSAGAVILLLGTGWQNILWPFQIGFMGSTFLFVLALLFLDRNDRRGDWGACIATAGALGCSGVGVPAAVAIVLGLVMQRSTRSRWWIAGGPLLLYALWYLSYGEGQIHASDAGTVPGYVGDAAAGAFAGFFALDIDWGRLLAAVTVILAVAILVRRRGVTPRVIVLAASLLGFWVLTALSRGQYGEPAASRYVYVGGVIVLLLAAELAARSHATAFTGVAAVFAVVSAWSTASTLRANADVLRTDSQVVGAELAVVESLHAVVPSDYWVDRVHAPQVVTGRYLAAVSGLHSSPASPIAEVPRMPPEARAAADRVLLDLVPPRVVPSAGTPTPCVATGSVETRPGASFFVRASAAGAEIRFSRFGDAPADQGKVVVRPFGQVQVTFTDDPIDRHWTAQLIGDTGALMCALGR